MVYIGELQDQEEPQLLSEPEVLNPGENYRLPIVTAVSAHIMLNETAVTFWSSFHCILSHCLGNIQSEDFLFFSCKADLTETDTLSHRERKGM